MDTLTARKSDLLEMIKDLPEDKIQEVMNYVDFLRWKMKVEGINEEKSTLLKDYEKRDNPHLNFKQWSKAKGLDIEKISDDEVGSLACDIVHEVRRSRNVKNHT